MEREMRERLRPERHGSEGVAVAVKLIHFHLLPSGMAADIGQPS